MVIRFIGWCFVMDRIVLNIFWWFGFRKLLVVRFRCVRVFGFISSLLMMFCFVFWMWFFSMLVIKNFCRGWVVLVWICLWCFVLWEVICFFIGFGLVMLMGWGCICCFFWFSCVIVFVFWVIKVFLFLVLYWGWFWFMCFVYCFFWIFLGRLIRIFWI